MAEHNCAIGRNYVRASFKGVPFETTEADIEGGRRGAEGEFPFGENTAYADLGRKIRVFHITAVFRRDSHVPDASALFAACESPGPGILVHPTRGTHMVACRSVKVKDKTEDEQGQSTAELEFVEANIRGTLASGSGRGPGFLWGIIVSDLNTASRASFTVRYRPMEASQPWRQDVIALTQGLVKAVAQTAQQTLTLEASIQEWRDVLAVEEVANDVGLASVAANVDKALSSGFLIINENIKDPEIKFTTMRRLVNLTAVPTTTMPPLNAVATQSVEAVLSRFRVLAGVGMAEAAMARKYTHINEVLDAMDMVLVVLADETKVAYNDCDNGLYLELRKYAVQFSEMMNTLAYRLPPLIMVNFMGGVHPLVAAYVIYTDAKRHRELEQRNIVDANGRFQPYVVGISPR